MAEEEEPTDFDDADGGIDGGYTTRQTAWIRQRRWQQLDDGPNGFATTAEKSAEGGEPEDSTTTTWASTEEDESVDDGGGAMTGRQRELWRKKTALRNWLQQRRR